MSSIDVKKTATYSIGGRAENFDIFLGIIWNSAIVLLIVCISVKGNTNDPRFEIGWELGDCVENNGSSLTNDILLVLNDICHFEARGSTTHLKPPATIVVSLHFSAAFLMCLVASAIAEAVVPLADTLSARPAEYAGPLTPWHATSLLKIFFNPEHRPGPTLLVLP
jgi:hypothetical protein